MLINCESCGKKINRKPSQIRKHVFCSQECFKKLSRLNKSINGNYSGGKYVLCSICNKSHYRTPSGLKRMNGYFCSRKCYGAWMSKNMTGEKASNYKNKAKMVRCSLCGNKFKTRSESRKFCSLRCRGAYQTKVGTTKKKCACCDIIFSIRKSAIEWQKTRGYETKFCSKKCNAIYYSGENHPNWIADRSKLKDRDKTIRWSKKMREWRKMVYERDNYTCKLCGVRSAKGQRVELNAHHIKTFKKHKKLRHDLNNGITLCNLCHKKTYWKELEYEDLFFKKIHIEREHIEGKT